MVPSRSTRSPCRELNDGNRDPETFTLHAEIASRNRDDIEDASETFTVLDIHKLPPLTVESGYENMLTEGGEIELTLVLDRNPRDTIAIDPETRLYTSEPVDVAVPALPVIAQLLLAAFLAVGGYRRYRRR